MMDKLEELAARVEALDGPSRKVDAEIHATVSDDRPHPYIVGVFIRLSGAVYSCPAYTASLDAALSLVPTRPYPNLRPGKWWWMLEVREFESLAHVAYENHDCGIPEFSGKGKTPALALTAAALRARAGTGVT